MQGVVPNGDRLFPFCGESETVEERNGIGGEMVLAGMRKAAAGRPHGTGVQPQAVNPGKAMLNAQADMKLRDNRATIVDTLYNCLVNDKNMVSAKLLFALADGRINCEDPVVMKELCRFAATLKSEQQVPDAEVDALLEKEQDKGEAEE